MGPNWLVAYPWDEGRATSARKSLENAALQEIQPQEAVLLQQKLYVDNPANFGSDQDAWVEFMGMKGIYREKNVVENTAKAIDPVLAPVGIHTGYAAAIPREYAISDEEMDKQIDHLPISIAIIAASAGLGSVAGAALLRGVSEIGLGVAGREALAFGVSSGARQAALYGSELLVNNTVFTASSMAMHAVADGKFNISANDFGKEWGTSLVTLGGLGMLGRAGQALNFDKISALVLEGVGMGTMNGQFTMDDLTMILGLKLLHGGKAAIEDTAVRKAKTFADVPENQRQKLYVDIDVSDQRARLQNDLVKLQAERKLAKKMGLTTDAIVELDRKISEVKVKIEKAVVQEVQSKQAQKLAGQIAAEKNPKKKFELITKKALLDLQRGKLTVESDMVGTDTFRLLLGVDFATALKLADQRNQLRYQEFKKGFEPGGALTVQERILSEQLKAATDPKRIAEIKNQLELIKAKRAFVEFNENPGNFETYPNMGIRDIAGIFAKNKIGFQMLDALSLARQKAVGNGKMTPEAAQKMMDVVSTLGEPVVKSITERPADFKKDLEDPTSLQKQAADLRQQIRKADFHHPEQIPEIIAKVTNPADRLLLEKAWEDLSKTVSKEGADTLNPGEKQAIFEFTIGFLADFKQFSVESGKHFSVQEIFELVQSNQRKLAHQAVFDKLKLTGSDHGVTHLLEGNMRRDEKAMDDMKMSIRDRMLVRQALIDHDMGYTMDGIRNKTSSDGLFSFTKDHPIYSALYVEAHRALYEKYFGVEGYQIIHNAVLDHSVVMTSNRNKLDALKYEPGREYNPNAINAVTSMVDCLGTTADVKIGTIYTHPEIIGKMQKLRLLMDANSVAGPDGKRFVPAENKAKLQEQAERVLVEMKKMLTGMNDVDAQTRNNFIGSIESSLSSGNFSYPVDSNIGMYGAAMKGIAVESGTGKLTVNMAIDPDMQQTIRDSHADPVKGQDVSFQAVLKAMMDFGFKETDWTADLQKLKKGEIPEGQTVEVKTSGGVTFKLSVEKIPAYEKAREAMVKNHNLNLLHQEGIKQLAALEKGMIEEDGKLIELSKADLGAQLDNTLTNIGNILGNSNVTLPDGRSAQTVILQMRRQVRDFRQGKTTQIDVAEMRKTLESIFLAGSEINRADAMRFAPKAVEGSGAPKAVERPVDIADATEAPHMNDATEAYKADLTEPGAPPVVVEKLNPTGLENHSGIERIPVTVEGLEDIRTLGEYAETLGTKGIHILTEAKLLESLKTAFEKHQAGITNQSGPLDTVLQHLKSRDPHEYKVLGQNLGKPGVNLDLVQAIVSGKKSNIYGENGKIDYVAYVYGSFGAGGFKSVERVAYHTPDGTNIQFVALAKPLTEADYQQQAAREAKKKTDAEAKKPAPIEAAPDAKVLADVDTVKKTVRIEPTPADKAQYAKTVALPNEIKTAKIIAAWENPNLLKAIHFGPDHILYESGPDAHDLTCAQPREFISGLADAMNGIEKIQNEGFVHGDIKPSNILTYTGADGVNRGHVIDITLTSKNNLVDPKNLKRPLFNFTDKYADADNFAMVVKGDAKHFAIDNYSLYFIIGQFIEANPGLPEDVKTTLKACGQKLRIQKDGKNPISEVREIIKRDVLPKMSPDKKSAILGDENVNVFEKTGTTEKSPKTKQTKSPAQSKAGQTNVAANPAP